MAEPTVVLASASPRRAELLALAGLAPVVRPVDVDEAPWHGEEPGAYVRRLARAKARAADLADGEVAVGADTAVVLDGRVLGKPRDAGEASGMLTRLSGRTHEVHSGVAVRGPGAVEDVVVRTSVTMVALAPPRIAAYVASGEPFDKAGGYGIQGPAAAFVTRIEGSWTSVVGLPLAETLALLEGTGVGLP
ncbi:MAG: Maf family protein [Egibacteraceae bacterium]